MGVDLLSEDDLLEMGVDDKDDLDKVWSEVKKNKRMEGIISLF